MRLPTGRIFWGLLLSLLGVVWLLNNLGLATVSLGTLWENYWPVIVIYFAVAGIVEAVTVAGTGRGVLWGTLVVNGLVAFVFTVVLGNKNGWFAIDLSLLWKLAVPALLLLIGVTMMAGGMRRPGARSYWAVMSGSKDVRTTWEDIAAVAVMGGADVDLSRAGLPDRDVLIDVYAVMGGVDIRVPEGVQVVCDWTGIMGGASVVPGHEVGTVLDHRQLVHGSGSVVRVKALTIMGGVKVRQVPAPLVDERVVS